jgi:predicted regulator of Ras-like GTPase activity (Roadblock/LC7/MglB family)
MAYLTGLSALGVDQAVFTGMDGLVIEALGQGPPSAEALAAELAALARRMDPLAQALGGKVLRFTLATEDREVLAVRVGEFLLGAVVHRGLNRKAVGQELSRILEGLLERGVRGAALLRPDGLLLEAVGEASGAAERAAALLGLGVALAQSQGEEVAELVVEYPEGALFLAPVAGHHLLLLLEDLQDLGRARVALKGVRLRIEEALA